MHIFTTDEFAYMLSFNRMCQRNMDERYLTERSVRRRPKFHSVGLYLFDVLFLIRCEPVSLFVNISKMCKYKDVQVCIELNTFTWLMILALDF